MKQHIALLTAFDEYIDKHPGKSLEDFYSYIGNQSRTAPEKKSQPSKDCHLLMRSIGRLTNCFQLYMRTALKDQEMEVPEGYPLLASLNFYGEMRKSELINFNLMEISTGAEILNRLRKHKLIAEKADKNDKRAKMVSITEKGKKRLYPFLEIAKNLRLFIFKDIPDEDIKACLSVLEPMEARHSRMVVSERNEVIGQIMPKMGSGK